MSAADAPGERLRPRLHLTARSGWINDPNGPVWINGRHHVFFQHNPFADQWGHMSWGHAVSEDLLAWRERPVAIPETDTMAFSGCVVVDHRNASGLGADGAAPALAVFTAHNPATRAEAQALALSLDGGETWARRPGPPVLDEGGQDFRDPKVIRPRADGGWILAVARAAQNAIAFYGSDTLLDWRYLGAFGPCGPAARYWECPDLLPLPGAPDGEGWALVVSVSDGGPNGGSGVRYFIGDLVDGVFAPAPDWPSEPVWLDHGPDFYAATSWSERPRGESGPLLIAWANNWRYADTSPTSPWRGALTFPRVLSAWRSPAGPRLHQAPHPAIVRARTASREWTLTRMTAQSPPFSAAAEAGLCELELSAEQLAGAAITLTLADPDGSGLSLRLDPGHGEVRAERTGPATAPHPGFGEPVTAPLADLGDRLTLRLLFDRSLAEAFFNDGTSSLTLQTFLDPDRAVFTLSATGPVARVRLVVHPLRPPEAAPEIRVPR